ncbi:MAG TPA: DUF4912 domain-containing protein [Clostridia bacterium]|jgi:hypothetical protein|nr:DUF4912 domain-containing protein [Clostridia bacterium]
MSQVPITADNLPKELIEPDYSLADSYDETYGVLMPIDPERAYVHWEISDSDQKLFSQKYADRGWEFSQLALRLSWNKGQKIIYLADSASNWYVHLGSDGLPNKGEIGRVLPDSSFIPILVLTMFWKIKGYPVRRKLKESLTSWKTGISL